MTSTGQRPTKTNGKLGAFGAQSQAKCVKCEEICINRSKARFCLPETFIHGHQPVLPAPVPHSWHPCTPGLQNPQNRDNFIGRFAAQAQVLKNQEKIGRNFLTWVTRKWILMIEAVLVDDEEKAIQSLNWELTNFSKEIEVIASFTDPYAALDYLRENTPDCLFLDIEMPAMDGFQFIQKLQNRDLAVVITTAYNQYAIQALKNEAIDYLLKPIDADDLKETIGKIHKHRARNLRAERLERHFNGSPHPKKITLNTDGKLVFLENDDILYAESDGNYSTLFLSDGRKIVLTKKLKEVDQLLPGETFFRIHNSYIINLEKVKEYLKTDGYVILEANHKIPVSRKKKSEFLDLF